MAPGAASARAREADDADGWRRFRERRPRAGAGGGSDGIPCLADAPETAYKSQGAFAGGGLESRGRGRTRRDAGWSGFSTGAWELQFRPDGGGGAVRWRDPKKTCAARRSPRDPQFARLAKVA